jgi:hypothetical protein
MGWDSNPRNLRDTPMLFAKVNGVVLALRHELYMLEMAVTLDGQLELSQYHHHALPIPI